jgi:hypothetical protein
MGELLQLQIRFALAIAMLPAHARSLGLFVTKGESFRSEWEATRLAKAGLGIKASLHTMRLADDYMLFDAQGTYFTSTQDHYPIGIWWEKQDPAARWGGRFGDGNHYSFAYKGLK